jgi:uncharacterized protein (DUF58 family)
VTGPDLAAGGLLSAGLALLALALFVLSIRIGRWALWLTAYLAAALAIAVALAGNPAGADLHGSLRQRSGTSGVLTSVEGPSGTKRGPIGKAAKEGQRVDRVILEPDMKAS